MIQLDYHLHCLNSPDSKESLEAICQAAIQKDLKEIMVTDHYEIFTYDYGRNRYRSDYLDQSFDTVLKCREKYRDQLYVGFGIELGQLHLQPDAAARIVKEYPFDYVIASLHKLDDLDLKYYDYSRTDVRDLCRRYLNGLNEIAEIGDFDCIGHMDLIKRYAAEQGYQIRIEDEEETVRKILRTLVERKKGLEVNTSGIRQKVGECFPSEIILKWYVEEGGKFATVGSDAHCGRNVGEGLTEADKLLNKVGFLHVDRFRSRVRI